MCARMLELAFETRLDLMCENRHRIKTTAQKNKGMRQKRKWDSWYCIAMAVREGAGQERICATPLPHTANKQRRHFKNLSELEHAQKKGKGKEETNCLSEHQAPLLSGGEAGLQTCPPPAPRAQGGSGAKPCAQLRSTIRPRDRKKGEAGRPFVKRWRGEEKCRKVKSSLAVKTPLARSTA